MDHSKKVSYAKDALILGLVTLMSIGANLPDAFARRFGLSKQYLLIGLIAMVAVSLVRYLKFTLILAIAILAVGANLPADIAAQLHIDKGVMLLALVAMVATSLINYVLNLPKGVKPIAQINSLRGARALVSSAAKGHASMVYSLISAGINPNFRDQDGNLALVVAAARGHALVVKLLLDNGADAMAADAKGTTALAAATQGGYSQTATLLRNAELLHAGPSGKAPLHRGPRAA